MLKLEYRSYILNFKFDAGTSRGVMTEREVWFLKIYDDRIPEVYGLGEVAPLHRLSDEDPELIPAALQQVERNIKSLTTPLSEDSALETAATLCPPRFASIRFGLEMGLLDLVNGGNRIIYKNDFVLGKRAIPINGLIWMGEVDFMERQIKEKVSEGYDCIKMKVGALDFDRELELIASLRKEANGVQIRVDANGAFPNNEALHRLIKLSQYNLHSIEQPIIPKQPEAMQLLCKKGAVDIALDEELIGIGPMDEKRKLLEFLKPQHIVLKPTLLGGFMETSEWIGLAEELEIGWWVTSALESNIGLNAIAQYTSRFRDLMPQGLGTGRLFHNNFEGPLYIEKGYLHYDTDITWDIDLFD
ncbi:MAG: o-succinylbenzoate synthase [Bacteroidota bacterium]